jgi:hypothetical protein
MHPHVSLGSEDARKRQSRVSRAYEQNFLSFFERQRLCCGKTAKGLCRLGLYLRGRRSFFLSSSSLGSVAIKCRTLNEEGLLPLERYSARIKSATSNFQRHGTTFHKSINMGSDGSDLHMNMYSEVFPRPAVVGQTWTLHI